jgi:hypothetical protein
VLLLLFCFKKQKFSVLTLLRRLFLLRTSAKSASSLCPRFGVGSAFTLQTKTEKQKFSVFRFPFFAYLCIFVAYCVPMGQAARENLKQKHR